MASKDVATYALRYETGKDLWSGKCFVCNKVGKDEVDKDEIELIDYCKCHEVQHDGDEMFEFYRTDYVESLFLKKQKDEEPEIEEFSEFEDWEDDLSEELDLVL